MKIMYERQRRERRKRRLESYVGREKKGKHRTKMRCVKKKRKEKKIGLSTCGIEREDVKIKRREKIVQVISRKMSELG